MKEELSRKELKNPQQIYRNGDCKVQRLVFKGHWAHYLVLSRTVEMWRGREGRNGSSGVERRKERQLWGNSTKDYSKKTL